MRKMIFALLIIPFTLWSCIFKFDPNIEYDVGLPSTTASGENTFGCKINRFNWRAESEYSSHINKTHLITDSKFIYDRKEDSTTIIIKGACFRHVPKAYEKISLQFKSKGIPKQDFTYVLGKNANIDINHFTDNNTLVTHNTDKSENLGSNQIIMVKVDTINKIVAGSFEGQLIDSNKNKLIITEGRFDILLKKILYQ